MQKKMEHEVLMDDMQTISESDDTYWENKLPNDYDDIIKWSKDDVKWTTKKELYSILCKGFLMSNGQGWFFLAKSGKRCVMLPARSSLLEKQWNWMHQSESSIVCKIKSQILSPETTYACYLVYKLPPEKTSGSIEFPLKVKDANFHDESDREYFNNFRSIYLLSPQIPVIRPRVDQKSHNPLNRPKLKGIPRQKDDGWMEVQGLDEIPSAGQETYMTYFSMALKGISVQGIEFRPE
ncbi:F-box protein At2g02240-like [Helianthus annuus]|uniref:F-box protein At2g02240-like n=1 Tax=Helianthus annuus TaxID=4232 RepID=UPI000B8F0DCF|nr:F-box protein At2g02240-like [Helianthus annuus]